MFNTENFTFLLIFTVLTFYGIIGNKKDGSIQTGMPARDAKKMRRIDGALSKLPDLIYKVRDLEKKIK